jgi:chromate reductase
VPLYDADLDRDGARPEPVEELKRRIAEADGVLIASPEYCYSVPGVLKNALDWVSRPGYKSVLVAKRVGIIGASASAMGTARAQMHLREVIYSCLAVTFPHTGVLVAQAAGKFEDGRLTDEPTRDFLAAYLRAFAEFVGSGTIRPAS